MKLEIHVDLLWHCAVWINCLCSFFACQALPPFISYNLCMPRYFREICLCLTFLYFRLLYWNQCLKMEYVLHAHCVDVITDINPMLTIILKLNIQTGLSHVRIVLTTLAGRLICSDTLKEGIKEQTMLVSSRSCKNLFY